MLRVLRLGATTIETAEPSAGGFAVPADAVWIDMLDPTREEESAVEGFVGVPLPTREDMVEIEASSRLYRENGATVMTASILANAYQEMPDLGPVTFVLVGERLVTIRYIDPRSFQNFVGYAERQPSLCATGVDSFLNLLEAIVDRLADVLEHASATVEEISRAVFAADRTQDFAPQLSRLARVQNLDAKARESLFSLGRLVGYAALAPQLQRQQAREQLESLTQDIRSLNDHAGYLANNIAFLLDATMGFINIQQNAIIKIFSVAAVAFLPPTLIASLYGMNFEHMPELDWRLGYPMAIVMMILSAVVPLWWFRKKGWL